MSRRGNPYDNAKAESFIKMLKMEEVYLYEYENTGDAYSRVGEFIEQVYNQKRLHSAMGYVPPVEFEQSLVRSKNCLTCCHKIGVHSINFLQSSIRSCIDHT
jgi:transposase InsO family protein